MQGDPIKHARAAARKVVESMQDGDLIALVTFDSHASTVIEPTVLGPQSRRRALATIHLYVGFVLAPDAALLSASALECNCTGRLEHLPHDWRVVDV